MEKLLIIGNGFDLRCGLETSYKSFFDYLLKQNGYKEIYESIFNEKDYKNTGRRINIWWALMLTYHDNGNHWLWKDIEEIMQSFLVSKTDKYAINFLNILDEFSYIFDKFNKDHKYSNLLSNRTPQIYQFIWILYQSNGIKDFCNITSNTPYSFTATKKGVEEVVKILKDDLIELEQRFSEFLGIQLESKQNVHSNANHLYKKLLEVDFISNNGNKVDLEDYLNKTNVLSFNYTRLGNPNGMNYSKFKNIHGTFLNHNNKEIIFGIDSGDLSPIDPCYIFTKTYRLSLLEGISKNRKDIFDAKISLNNISDIAIYGHSLNKQDYSYFYAIFNKSNINESQTKITLFYSDYENEDKSYSRSLDLQKLIFDYEKEFNKPKGLYHRMLIEDRIGIQKV